MPLASCVPALRGPLSTAEIADCYRNDLLDQCPNILNEFEERELPNNWCGWHRTIVAGFAQLPDSCRRAGRTQAAAALSDLPVSMRPRPRPGFTNS